MVPNARLDQMIAPACGTHRAQHSASKSRLPCSCFSDYPQRTQMVTDNRIRAGRNLLTLRASIPTVRIVCEPRPHHSHNSSTLKATIQPPSPLKADYYPYLAPQPCRPSCCGLFTIFAPAGRTNSSHGFQPMGRMAAHFPERP